MRLFYDHGLNKDTVGITSKVLTKKKKKRNYNLDLIKIMNFCTLKETIQFAV